MTQPKILHRIKHKFLLVREWANFWSYRPPSFVDLNLKTSFQNDESLRIWFRSFAAISLLPQEDMNAASEYLRSIKPVSYENEIDLFLEYHNKTYGYNSSFPPKMYNH
jgi:hypothetical protein